MKKDQKIAVLGAGTMGAGMAATYGAYGFPVCLYSRTEETLQRALRVIENALQLFAEEGLIASGEIEAAFSRIRFIGYEIADGSIYNQRRMEREDRARSAYLQNHGSNFLLNENELYVRDIIQQRVKNDDPRL